MSFTDWKPAHPDLRYCVTAVDKGADFLLPEEKPIINNFAAGRALSFCSGRYCAHKCLESMGYPDFPVLRREDGAPVWPSDVAGSISHSDSVAIAITAKKQNFRSVGLDIEATNRLKPELWSILFTTVEQKFLTSRPESEQQILATIFFSIKESFYKLMSVFSRDFIDFQDVEVTKDGDGFFVRPLIGSATPVSCHDVLPAFVSLCDAHAITYLVL